MPVWFGVHGVGIPPVKPPSMLIGGTGAHAVISTKSNH